MTSEDMGSAEVCVSVEEGVVTGPITLTAYTEDGSAKRENNCFSLHLRLSRALFPTNNCKLIITV